MLLCYMIRDRFVEKADLCLNLYPCVSKYDFLLSLFLPLSLFSPSPSLFPSLSLSPSFTLSHSLPLSLPLSPLPIPSPFLSSCPSVLRRGICGCFLRRKGMWTDKWSLLLKLHCLLPVCIFILVAAQLPPDLWRRTCSSAAWSQRACVCHGGLQLCQRVPPPPPTSSRLWSTPALSGAPWPLTCVTPRTSWLGWLRPRITRSVCVPQHLLGVWRSPRPLSPSRLCLVNEVFNSFCFLLLLFVVVFWRVLSVGVVYFLNLFFKGTVEHLSSRLLYIM